MDSVKKWILFLLGSCCLKLSNSIINLVSYLIWNSFLNRNRNLFCLLQKQVGNGLWHIDSYISTVLLQEIQRVVCEKKRLSLGLVIWYLWVAIWNSERGLFSLGFGFTVWWFALSFYVATFGFDLWLSLWFVRNSHLVFGIWYSYLVFVNLWFFGSVFVRKKTIWDLGLWEYFYTNLYYPKFIIVKFVWCCLWI